RRIIKNPVSVAEYPVIAPGGDDIAHKQIVLLLNLSTRRVSFTPQGMQYPAQSQDISALIEHSESSLSESVARPQGRLRV
ncbi:MAG: hypothetical protein E6269_03840, partial [Clostridiales bacterium]|nr:hypothetical protein [Streptococcus sp.]MDU5019657.1 hypothetical protein [Clostridiales bacterium]